ncbi:hypothetical protein [Jiangella endophytica]|uniref:hypothetical protein n=1 Tax=Jiangella endophytica TaxID=1623398 RepID=UPI0013003A72|nr:hypothetical protein [Jiangella endophytica]
MTLREWNEALTLGLRFPPRSADLSVGPVPFSWHYADFEMSAGEDAGRDAPEDDDPFEVIEWDDEEDDDLIAA